MGSEVVANIKRKPISLMLKLAQLSNRLSISAKVKVTEDMSFNQVTRRSEGSQGKFPTVLCSIATIDVLGTSRTTPGATWDASEASSTE